MAFITETYVVKHSKTHLYVGFSRPRPVLSSAVLNGGFVEASHIVNLRVKKETGTPKAELEPAAVTLERYCRQKGWAGTVVGMMTAADMNSFQVADRAVKGVKVKALITAGISNAGRAGDPAACQDINTHLSQSGTINIVILTDARLTRPAMVEAVQMATEAKTAALQDLGIRSKVSGAWATGTGTDAVVIAGGFGPTEVRYCGKHMIFGEMLASTVIEAITSSLKRQQSSN